jgi:hypothetical protein
MAYIGQDPVIGRYIIVDQISGGFNGTASGFTLAAGGQGVIPGLAQNVLLSLGGVIQQPGTDYTVSGSGITFTTPPLSGTTFFATVLGDVQAVGTPSDGTVLPASIASSGTFVFPNITTTGTTLIASGNASTPSLAVIGDTNTGLYSPGADQLSITTGGTERFRIDNAGQLEAVSLGTVAAPTFSFTTDPNTGIYSPGADQLAISTNGARRLLISNGQIQADIPLTVAMGGVGYQTVFRSGANEENFITHGASGFTVFRNHNGSEFMRLDSSGRLGVGTSAPTALLSLVGSNTTNSQNVSFLATDASNTTFRIGHTTGSNCNIGPNTNHNLRLGAFTDSAGQATAFTPYLTLDTSGRVGIGTSTPSSPLHINGTANSTAITLSVGGTVTGYIGPAGFLGGSDVNMGYRVESGNNQVFYIGASEKVRIDSSGRVGIGTTSPSYLLDLQGSGAVSARVLSSGSDALLRLTNTTASTGREFYISSTNSGNLIFVDNTSGGQRMALDSSGRLLVGTSTASQASTLLLQGRGSATGSAIARLCTTDATPANGASLGIVAFSDSGHTTAAQISVVRDGGTWTSGTSQPTRLEFSTTQNGTASPTEAMRINQAQNVLIGNTSSNEPCRLFSQSNTDTVGPQLVLHNVKTGTASSNSVVFYRNSTSTGSIATTNTAVAYNTSSDYRLKENVTAVTDGIARLQQLKPSRFNFKADPDNTVDGFIAHEAQAVVPECATGTKDAVDADGNPVYQGIDQSKLVPLLTAALQEAVGRIETLEAEVAALKGA